MKTSHLAAMALIVFVAGTPMRATDTNRTQPADVRFSTTERGEVVIPVYLGGEGPYRFLLDTGSSNTAISQTLATELGAVPVAKAPIDSAVGSIVALIVRLPDVVVGSARVESLLAAALPPNAAGRLGNGISGVLGQDFLSQFDYTLDYRNLRLSWNDPGQIEKGIRLTLASSRGRLLVSLPQVGCCRCPLRLVPDSGANGVVLFTGTEADRLPLDTPGDLMSVSTLVGAGTARRVTVRELRVGSATLWDVPAARVVLPEGTIEEGDGLLPLSIFGRVSFYHHEGFMVVQPPASPRR